MWVTLPAFGATAYMPTIMLERGLFVRERNDGLYRTFTYLLAKMIEEILISVFITLGVAAFVFYGIGFVGACCALFCDTAGAAGAAGSRRQQLQQRQQTHTMRAAAC